MSRSNKSVWNAAEKREFGAEWDRVRAAVKNMLRGCDIPITCDYEGIDYTEQPENVAGFRIIWAYSEKKQEHAYFDAVDFADALDLFRSLHNILYKSFETVYI